MPGSSSMIAFDRRPPKQALAFAAMHQPELYADTSRKVFHQRLSDVTRLLESLSSPRRSSRTVKVLDVGCGPGDFTEQELLPRLSARQRCRVVGVDSEPSMVRYANQHHARPGILSFHRLNIADPHIEATDVWQMAPFDIIFSYYCLHWVQDQSQAVKNLFKLLSEDHGEVILVFVAKDGLADAYRNLSRSDRWRAYLQDYEKYIWAYQNSTDPAEDFRKLMERTEFTVTTCTWETKLYDFKTVTEAKGQLSAICPFISRIEEERRSEFLQDFLTECLKTKFLTKCQKGESEYIGSSEALFVKAQKLKL